MKIYITTGSECAIYLSEVGDDDKVYILTEEGHTLNSMWESERIEEDLLTATPSFREISLTGKQLYDAIVDTYKEED